MKLPTLPDSRFISLVWLDEMQYFVIWSEKERLIL